MVYRLLSHQLTVFIIAVGFIMLRPGLHDIRLLFMPDRFYESNTENTPECVYTKSCTEFREHSLQSFSDFVKIGVSLHQILQGWTGMYTLVVPSLSTKFIKSSHQNLPV